MKVDAAAQAAFVALSGDANPLHTDPLAARRLPFGRVAVHGVHLALLALDAWGGAGGSAPGHVRATFRRPVGVDDEAGHLSVQRFADCEQCGDLVARVAVRQRGPAVARGRIGVEPVGDGGGGRPQPHDRSRGAHVAARVGVQDGAAAGGDAHGVETATDE